MTISFQCSRCNRTLKVADELAGRKAKCPQCQTVLFIPEGPASAVSLAPVRKRAAAPRRAAAPEEMPDPAAEETEGRERTRPRKKAKKQQKSLLLPLLLAGGGVLLLLVGGGAALGVWWFLSGAAPDDNYFLPDNTQMVAQVRVSELMNSGAMQQARAAFPDFDKQITQAGSQSSGVDPNNVDRIYLGSQAVAPGAVTTPGSAPPNLIAILHMKQPVKPADLEASAKKSDPTLTFTETKVGRFTVYEGKSSNPAVSGAPPSAFTMPDDKRVVAGPSALLQMVLKRDKAPDLSDKLQATIKQTDFDHNTIAFAANARDAFPHPTLQVAQPGGRGGAPPAPAGAPNISFDKVDGVSVTVKVANDVDVTATAICQDGPAANDLRDNLKKGLDQLRGIVAFLVLAGKAPGDVNDLLDVNMQVNGSNVTASKTIKVAEVIKMVKDQQKAAAPIGFPGIPGIPGK